MQTKEYKISELKQYEDNPRTIDVAKFEALKESIKDFPEMLSIRPIIIDMSNVILAGNMRYLACRELGHTTIFARQVDLPDDKVQQLLIKDNLSYGEWDQDALEFNWDMDLVDKWLGKEPMNYDDVDYEDLEANIESLQQGVKKALQINIDIDQYEIAKELEKKCRDAKIYIGGELIELMQQVKLEYEKD